MTNSELPPTFRKEDAEALRELADAGIGEGDFDDDHSTPSDFLYAYECLEAERLGL